MQDSIDGKKSEISSFGYVVIVYVIVHVITEDTQTDTDSYIDTGANAAI